MKNVTYDDVLAQAVALDGDKDYRYLAVDLAAGDTAVNSASTKRVLHGPGVVLYEVSAWAVNTYEFESVDTMNDNARRVYDALHALSA